MTLSLIYFKLVTFTADETNFSHFDFDFCLLLDLLVEMELIEPKIMIMNDGPRYVCSRCGVKYKKGFFTDSSTSFLIKLLNLYSVSSAVASKGVWSWCAVPALSQSCHTKAKSRKAHGEAQTRRTLAECHDELRER